ncbi:hypothetical protein ElyMa_005008400 [Elysia marginata]|uniref:Uncharacterized protein n=1 Tax=Elysia marginata TaxID=1093978 RepID=A0AAV4JAW4_9GAST|nr:hypothetical protein ElyMa_005008400 [Elysia marginata]
MPYMGPDCFKTYPLRFAGYGLGLAEALSGSVTYPVVNGLRIMATGFIFAHTIYRPLQVGKVNYETTSGTEMNRKSLASPKSSSFTTSKHC